MKFEYKEIYKRADDSSWFILMPNKTRKFYINPKHMCVVKKWRETDILIIITNERKIKYPFKLINLTASNYVSATLQNFNKRVLNSVKR